VFSLKGKDKWLCELIRTLYNFLYTDLIEIFKNQDLTSAQHCASSSGVLTKTVQENKQLVNEMN